jgi:2-dehydro-3-deoxyphosphogluconate aldolase / (4S)-4-hydroxy-2-oxoglutarate aldolase
MPRTREQILDSILKVGVIAIIRADSASQLVDITQALLAGGVNCIEVTMTTPNALEGIANLVRKFVNDACIGVGTVLDAMTTTSAIQAGAEFVVSPIFVPGVIQAAKQAGKVTLPGAFSPSEIYAAWKGGADIVKVFPATSLGPGYFKDLRGPFPQLKLTPTGGVSAETAGDWIKAGAVCVGAGSSLVSKQAQANSDWPAITKAAQALVEAVANARKK